MLSESMRRISPRPRPHQWQALPVTSRPSKTTASLLTIHRRQPTRSFRFGLWSSYLDDEFHKELRRRHRMLKHKYAESLNRRLSWDNYLFPEEPRLALRRVIARYWAPVDPTCRSRYVDQDELIRRSKHTTRQTATGSSAPKEKAANTSSTPEYWNNYDSWRSHVDRVVNQWTREASGAGSRSPSRPEMRRSRPDTAAKYNEDKQARNGSTSEEYFVIDPITNRKIQRKSPDLIQEAESEARTTTPRNYKSQFSMFAPPNLAETRNPVHPGRPSPSSGVKEHNATEVGMISGGEDTSQVDVPTELRSREIHLTPSQESIDRSQEYSLNHLPPEDAIEDEDNHGTSQTLHSDGVSEHATESSRRCDDVDKYDSAEFRDTDAEDRPFGQYGDLDKYLSFRSHDLDRDAILERDIVAETYKEHKPKSVTKPPLSTQSYDVSFTETSPKSRTHAKDENREELEKHMRRQNEASDEADREAIANLGKARARAMGDEPKSPKRILTGNYVRDFPEDFSGPWKSQTSIPSAEESGSSHTQEFQAEAQEVENKPPNSLDAAKPTKLEPALERQQRQPKLEPALDRHETRLQSRSHGSDPDKETGLDHHSRQPQNLEISVAKEGEGKKMMPVDVESRSSESSDPVPESKRSPEQAVGEQVLNPYSFYHRDPEIDGPGPPLGHLSEESSRSKSNPTEEPTVYKILAYDPTMQKINIAETTSIVPDQASPLSPTEVLLRLSNPTKFFPHFAPLQAEGFEIVSGSGDVLVFRKTRPTTTAADDASSSMPVNPIDMMGKDFALPNTAVFTSPTGFVNYDVPQVDETTQSPPFRSNIDVRREEPVFSGPKSSASEGDGQNKKRSNLGKRIVIGGVWVVGISYALGVVGEYFVTGGIDGKGPTGF